MRDQERIDYVKSLVSPEPSGWRDKAEFRRANRKWLRRSAEIAVRILSELQRRGISQAELARLMEVSPQQITKLVKGQENLTLDTIGKIELALDITLIDISKPIKNKDQGFHAIVENAKVSETFDINDKAEGERDNVRPLHTYTTTYVGDSDKYYE